MSAHHETDEHFLARLLPTIFCAILADGRSRQMPAHIAFECDGCHFAVHQPVNFAGNANEAWTVSETATGCELPGMRSRTARKAAELAHAHASAQPAGAIGERVTEHLRQLADKGGSRERLEEFAAARRAAVAMQAPVTSEEAYAQAERVAVAAGQPVSPRPEPAPFVPDSVNAAVSAKLLARAALGHAKYGQTMDRTDLTRREWFIHAQAEALDTAVYLEKLIQSEPADTLAYA